MGGGRSLGKSRVGVGWRTGVGGIYVQRRCGGAGMSLLDGGGGGGGCKYRCKRRSEVVQSGSRQRRQVNGSEARRATAAAGRLLQLEMRRASRHKQASQPGSKPPSPTCKHSAAATNFQVVSWPCEPCYHFCLTHEPTRAHRPPHIQASSRLHDYTSLSRASCNHGARGATSYCCVVFALAGLSSANTAMTCRVPSDLSISVTRQSQSQNSVPVLRKACLLGASFRGRASRRLLLPPAWRLLVEQVKKRALKARQRSRRAKEALGSPRLIDLGSTVR